MSTESTKRVLRTPTDEEIPALLEAVASTGVSIAAFAREHGLAPWKLYEARRAAQGGGSRRGRRGRRRDEGVFVPVRVVEERTGSAQPLELVLISGHRLVIPVGFDETTLRRLMGVVTSC